MSMMAVMSSPPIPEADRAPKSVAHYSIAANNESVAELDSKPLSTCGRTFVSPCQQKDIFAAIPKKKSGSGAQDGDTASAMI
jgi:hypothetical protein